MTPVEVAEGDGPLILAQPHGATWLPDAVAARLNADGRALADTDWRIGRLYEGLAPDATVVRATFHRYVIDANRDPGGASLYPGRNTTGLVPVTDFDGRPIWLAGAEPTAEDVAARLEAHHGPYHAALSGQIARVKARHGCAIVYDCHSIRSRIPFLFDGELPVFSIGTADGAACAPAIEAEVAAICRDGASTAVNGRFKGGWTTRRHGRPETGVHAVQMEIAQRAYIDEAPPWTWRAERAGPLRATLAAVLARLAALARAGV